MPHSPSERTAKRVAELNAEIRVCEAFGDRQCCDAAFRELLVVTGTKLQSGDD